jgi:hypothetical protein
MIRITSPSNFQVLIRDTPRRPRQPLTRIRFPIIDIRSHPKKVEMIRTKIWTLSHLRKSPSNRLDSEPPRWVPSDKRSFTVSPKTRPVGSDNRAIVGLNRATQKWTVGFYDRRSYFFLTYFTYNWVLGLGERACTIIDRYWHVCAGVWSLCLFLISYLTGTAERVLHWAGTGLNICQTDKGLTKINKCV